MTPSIAEEAGGLSATAKLFRRVLAFVLISLLVAYIVLSLRWPLVGDSQVMHYVSFLTAHGFAPYRQIWDMNMPGAYLVDRSALLLFGPADFGWRLYDYTLGALLTLGAMAIARRYDWIAGLAAAAIFTLTHGADGPPAAGQRDQVITVLLILACAALFTAVRRQKPSLLFLFGLASALAATIKPTFLPFAPLVFFFASMQLRRRRIALAPYLLQASAGLILGFAIVLLYLIAHGSLLPFFSLASQVIPHYAGIEQPTWLQMAERSLPLSAFVFIFFGAVIAFLRRREDGNWELTVLLLCAALGALSYAAQHKGFLPHRYTMMAFLLLWSAIQLSLGLRRTGLTRTIALAGLLVSLVYILPRDIYRDSLYPNTDDFTLSLQSDLSHLGVAQLQHQVQCFDVIDGCMTALFHLGIVQNSGATGDLLLFLPHDAPAVESARDKYWQHLRDDPPAVFIISNYQFGERRRNFDKLQTWPLFDTYLRSNYVLVKQREFHTPAPPTSDPGTNPDLLAYRIYIRHNSPLLGTPALADATGPQPSPYTRR